MLFNSFEFIFVFLPLTLFGFYKIGKQGHHRIAISWLVGTSLFFYGWWNMAYLSLILFSVLFNYGVGVSLSNTKHAFRKKYIMISGIAVNLALLGFYKYANFFIDNFNTLLDNDIILHKIILPLAISFFTFQQIAYLVDAYQGQTREYNFLHYCLFVTFFPQLIAGPIVHHKEMLPQFMRDSTYQLHVKHLVVGFTIFAIGLFKKLVLADGVAVYSTNIFTASDLSQQLTLIEAWVGAIAYSLQLYFDFSGYSDMAIGLARMFGIRLPLNFNSPYKATSIIDFWKRWHITLSRFLRDYLYIPLGGNRKGESRRYINLMITMLLGGLWHGAGWTFVFWGGLHGIYLVINSGWRSVQQSLFGPHKKTSPVRMFSGWLITIIAVVTAWVPFRATSIDSAVNILTSMAGINGISLPTSLSGKLGSLEPWLISHGVEFYGINALGDSRQALIWIVCLAPIALFFPNTQQLLCRYRPTSANYSKEIQRLRYRWMEWRPTLPWGLFVAVTFTISLLSLTKFSEFLYFQF